MTGLNQNIQVKDLLKICENEPYINQGTELDVQYFNIAEENERFFIIDGDLLCSYDFLRTFWINEINTKFDSDTYEVDFEQFVNRGCRSFYKAYGVDHPDIQERYLDLRLDEIEHVHLAYGQELFSVVTNSQMIRGEISIQLFIKKRVIPFVKNMHIGLTSNSLEQTPSRPSYITTAATKLLLDSDYHKMSLKLLSHQINTSDYDFDVKKPISHKYLWEQLKNIKLFKFSKLPDGIEIELLDKTDHFKNEFLKNIIPSNGIEFFDENIPLIGVFAISFNGKSFPVKEANEYVMLRNIIYLEKTEYLRPTIWHIFENRDDENPIAMKICGILNKKIRKIKDLKAFQDFLMDWIKKNIQVSYIKFDDIQALDTYYLYLKEELAPVLNTDSESNIFAQEIKKAEIEIEQYLFENQNEWFSSGGGEDL